MRISIITVVYNEVKTIARTIESVLSQSYNNVEYIIIDGGSTDGTLNVISKYRNKLAYFVSEQDDGIYDAMNKGIRKATGDIIGILNADDWYEPEALGTIANVFQDCEADVVYGQLQIIYNDGTKKLFERPGLETFYTQMAVPHPATFLRRSVYEKYGLFDTSFRIAADYELMLRLYTGGAKFEAVKYIVTNFSADGISSTNYFDLALEKEKLYLRYRDFCPYKEEADLYVQENVINAKARAVLEHAPESSSSILYAMVGRNSVVIWGTGIWGKRIYDICKTGNMDVPFFVDSDANKHGSPFMGRDVRRPESLRSYSGTVFVAVSGHDAEIAETLESIGNPNLRWILLQDFIAEISSLYDTFNVRDIRAATEE